MPFFNELKPHIKSSDTTNIIMSDVIIAFLFLIVLSSLYFGIRTLFIIFISMFSCFFFDLLSLSIKFKSFILPDFSSLVTGIIISLLMPANIPIYIVVFTDFFSIVIVKQCFGGLGQNIFNPAAGGFAFATLCWPDDLFIYPVPDIANQTNLLAQNVSFTLKLRAHPNIPIFDMLLGKQPGPIGSVHILVIISCLLWLIMRKSVYWPSILSFILSCTIIAFLFPRIHSARVLSVLYELFSGSLLFGAVFMITDPVTAPKYSIAKIVYTAIIGSLTMIFRYFGSFAQGICFAILLGNSLSFSLDMILYRFFNLNYFISEKR